MARPMLERARLCTRTWRTLDDALAPPESDGAARAWNLGKWATAGAALATALTTSGCPTMPITDPGDPSPDTEPAVLSPMLRRLINRSTFGINAREANLANQLGYDGYLEYQLAFETIDDSAVDAKIRDFPAINQTPRQIERRLDREEEGVFEEFFGATFWRSAYSTRQLYERMVEFWSNHFSMSFFADVEVLKIIDDREVIRANALGSFPDMLLASAMSPAMLIYLNNASSVAESPNQNYARELMELHTLGPDNYTQRDIEEVARCFTGWTINYDTGRFVFESEIHDDGPKQVLGYDIPAGGGQRDGEIVIEILATTPDIAPITARFLGRKLAVQCWGYDPPQGLVNAIADAYVSTNGDIKAMVRAAMGESWMASAPPKLKRPYHLLMSMLRARPSRITQQERVSHEINTLGNHPFFWGPPNGYPDTLEYWGQLVLPRWDLGAQFPWRRDAISSDLSVFFGEDVDATTFLDRVSLYYFDGALDAADRADLEAFLAPDPDSEDRRIETIGLALGSPGFQWY